MVGLNYARKDIYMGQNMRCYIYTFARRRAFQFLIDDVIGIFYRSPKW